MSNAVMDLRSGWELLLAEHNAGCARIHPVKDVSPECVDRFRRLCSGIVYRDWTVRLHHINTAPCIQICTIMPDSETGELMENNSRLLPLCPEMSDGFVIDLAFELIKEFEIHEAAEHFMINGVRPYFPHDPGGQPVREVRSVRSMPPIFASARR